MSTLFRANTLDQTPQLKKVKNKPEVDIRRQIKHPITFCSIALFLLGISTLILNLPHALSLDFRSILSAINALFIIIGVVGIIRLTRWGLYFLGFSLVFPLILIPFQLTSQAIMLVTLINLVIFIDLLIIFKAHGCKDVDLQKKFLKISKKYMLYVSIVLVIVLVTAFFNVLAAAIENKNTKNITQIIRGVDIANLKFK